MKSDAATALANSAVENAEVIVAAAEPDTVTVDTTVTVCITGSGFTEGSIATWIIDTVTAPGIRTLSTTYKSPTELDALIAISPDAELRAYSIRIRSKKGKQAIGVERFRVVAKPISLPEPGASSYAVDVNDSGVIVGNANDASGAAFAVRWTPVDTGWSYTILGAGSASAINDDGLIVRRDYDFVRRDWRSWIHFPSGAEVDLGPVSVSDIGNNGTLIGSVFDATFNSTGMVWRQVSATSWSTPQPLPLLPGYSRANAGRINSAGDISGTLSSATASLGVVWRHRDGQWQAPQPIDLELNAGASAINDTGALAGWVWPCVPGLPNCYSSPAFWPSLGSGRQMLPTLYNTMGFVRGMNDANQIVGSALVHYNDGSGPLAALVRHAVIWFPGGQFPEDLGAIRPWQAGEAWAINNRGLVVGSINTSDGVFANPHATVWRLPGYQTQSARFRARPH